MWHPWSYVRAAPPVLIPHVRIDISKDFPAADDGRGREICVAVASHHLGSTHGLSVPARNPSRTWLLRKLSPIRGGLLFNGDNFGTRTFGSASPRWMDGWVVAGWVLHLVLDPCSFVRPRIVLRTKPIGFGLVWSDPYSSNGTNSCRCGFSRLELVSGRHADDTPESLFQLSCDLRTQLGDSVSWGTAAPNSQPAGCSVARHPRVHTACPADHTNWTSKPAGAHGSGGA